MVPNRLTGKVAVVTGGASGIGRATALRLSAEGAAVGLIDLPQSQGPAVIAEITDAGGDALFLPADVTIADQLDAAFDRLVESAGALDLVFNNAGVNGPQAIAHELPEEEFDRVIAVNLKAVWLGIRAAAPRMLARGGAIVNTASTAAFIAYARMPAYNASKHGVLGLTRSAALEYADVPIRVNCVCPAPIDTPMVRETERLISPDDPGVAHRDFAAMQPLNRYGTPEEVAALVAFLLSDEAGFITGAAYAIDGGLLASP